MADEVIKNNEIKEILKKYISFKPEEQIQYISEVINSIKDISTSYPEFTENLVLIWNNSYNEVKSEKTIDFILPIFECIDLVQTNIFNNFFEKNFYLNRTISGLFGNTLKEIYGSLDVELQREIFQKMKISFQGSYSALSLLLEVSDVKIKQKEWKSLFEDLMDKSKIAEYIKKLTQREISIKNNDEKINTICLMMFKAFYLDIEEKFKIEICKDVLKKYKEGKISLDFIFEIWDNIPAELQVQNKDILKEIIEKYIDRAGLVLVWRKTCDELQIEYIDIIVKNLDRVNIWNAKTIWENTCEEAQCKNLQPQRTNEKESVNLDLEKASNGVGDVKEKNYLEKFLELCESDWDRKDIWKATKPKAQILCKKYFFNLLANEKYDNEVLSLLKECSQEFLENLAKEEDILKQFKDLFNMDSSSKHDSKFYIVFTYLWKKFSKQQQLDNIDLFLNAIQNQCTNYIVGKDNIWVNASNQDELWDFVFNEFKNNLRILEYVWYNTNQNLQKEKFNQIYETFGTIPACIWKNTNANLQEEWLLELEQAAEGDSERLAEIYSNLKTEIYEKNKERIDNYINENIDDSRIFLYFWYNLSEDLQKDRFVDLWHKVEDDQEKLFEFLRFTKYAIIKEKELEIFSYYKEKKNVFKELIGRLPIPEEQFNEILALCDKDIELEIALFSKLYTGKIINEMFEYLYFRVSEGKDIQTYINFWSAMRYNMQKEKIFVLEDILELSNIKIADVTEIIRNTNKKVLTQEILVKIFNSVIKNDEDRNRVVTKLLFLKELNSGIYKTVNLTFLSNEIVEIFNTEQLLRITADGQLQDRIAENLDNAVFLKILKYVVSNSENLVLELNGICNNLGEYKELLDNLAQNELEEIDLKNIINCISCSKNYYNVKTIDNLKNFTENKKTICQEILESKDISNNLSEDFKKLDSRQQKVFAMLQLVYGIDIEEAENIVKKYGADIDEITPKNEKEENVIKTIQALKIVLKCSEQDLEKIYFENKEKINNWEQIDYDSILTLEADCLNLYARLYNEAMKWEETELEDTEYEGKKVKIQKINSDFTMFIRVEGAYSYYEEPDNYKEYYEQVNINNNGNCKSSVANNMFARPRPKSPTFGYKTCKENSLYLMAPWDIVSRDANYSYSPAAVKWDFKNGIQFRIPSKNFDNVRHNHDEVVTNKWIYDETTGKLTQELPDFVLYVIENKEQNIEEDPMWRMTKKAAADLDIPIKIIDLEEVLEREKNKIERLKDDFKKSLLDENDSKNNELYLLERLVVEFENNRMSTRFASSNLRNKFFTDLERNELYNFIYEAIQDVKQIDEKRYIELKQKMREVIQNEIEKGYSIKGAQIVSKKELDYLKKLYEKNDGLNKEDDEQFKNQILQTIYSEYGVTQNDIEFLNKILEERINGKGNANEEVGGE